MLELPLARGNLGSDLCKLRRQIAENPSSVQLRPQILQKYGFGLAPNPNIPETAFSHRFQKVFTYPPQGNNILAHGKKSSKTAGKLLKPTELVHNECPREICKHMRDSYIDCTLFTAVCEEPDSFPPLPPSLVAFSRI